MASEIVQRVKELPAKPDDLSELHTGPAWWREIKQTPESSPLTSMCALKINNK